MKLSLRSTLSALVQRRMPIERRGGKRVAPTHRTLCLIQSPSEHERCAGTVHNLSNKGIAVLSNREYPLGSTLHVLLVNASHTFSVELDMKVVRAFRTPNEQFLVAGPFSRPLLHHEIVPLML